MQSVSAVGKGISNTSQALASRVSSFFNGMPPSQMAFCAIFAILVVASLVAMGAVIGTKCCSSSATCCGSERGCVE